MNNYNRRGAIGTNCLITFVHERVDHLIAPQLQAMAETDREFDKRCRNRDATIAAAYSLPQNDLFLFDGLGLSHTGHGVRANADPSSFAQSS